MFGAAAVAAVVALPDQNLQMAAAVAAVHVP
jgi:hypothetical protein